MQKHPKYAEKFKHLATSSFAVRTPHNSKVVIHDSRRASCCHRNAMGLLKISHFARFLQAKMFADNFLMEHKASGKHKSLTKEEIASINFCESLSLRLHSFALTFACTHSVHCIYLVAVARTHIHTQVQVHVPTTVQSKKSITHTRLGSCQLLAVTHETPFYGELNASLRSTNRSDVKTFFPWMKLMLSGLYKLPLGDPKGSPGSLTSVFRGVHGSSSRECGCRKIYTSIHSCCYNRVGK